jgi:NAD(P)-dependent dehydrogenase (short-subunit alcohol dehydrogenase family)
MVTRSLTVAITGANSGIGLRAARRLAAEGHQVYALCRDPQRGQAAVEWISEGAKHPARLVIADLANPPSITAAAARLTGELEQLDVLINNAAVFDQTMRQPHFTAAGHELFWATNHLGPFQLTAELSHLLADAPRPKLVFAASKGLIAMPRIAIRFDELDSTAWYSPTKAYYHAKLAQIMMSYHLALRTEERLDVTCVRIPAVRLDADRVAAMPWLLRTLYSPKNRMASPPERLADIYARIATEDTTRQRRTDEDPLRGIYLDEKLRPVRTPAFAHDAAARERLWMISQEATGNPRWAW